MLRVAREEWWVTFGFLLWRQAGHGMSCLFSVDRLWAQNFTSNQSICFTFYSVPVVRCSAQTNKGQRVYSAAYFQGTVRHGMEAKELEAWSRWSQHSHNQKQRVMTSWRCSAPFHHWHSTRCHSGSQGHRSGWDFSPEWMTSRQAYPSTPRGPSSRWLGNFQWTWQH